MIDNNDSSVAHSRAEEFLQIFKKGAEFTQGLLKENERLRFRVLELEQQLRVEEPSAELRQLQEKLERVEADRREILDRIGSVEKENIDYSNRYSEIEAENNLLANLYITTYQLHSTFDVSEIFRIIEEILLNLVGVEDFSLLLKSKDGHLLQPVITDTGDYQLMMVEVDDLQIQKSLKGGANWLAGGDADPQGLATEMQAVIPLQVDDDIIGVVAIRRLLEQKQGFTDIDEEIFGLLSGHAAMAICTAILRHENTDSIFFEPGLLP